MLALFGSAAQAAFVTLVLLSFIRLVEAVGGSASTIQAVISRYHHPLLGSLSGLATAVAIGMLLLPEGGMDAMAVAVSAGIAVMVLTPMAQLWIHERIHPFAPPFARAASVSVAVGAAVLILCELLLPLHHVIRIAIGSALMLAGIWLSGRLGLTEADKLALGKTGRRMRL